LKSIRAKTEDMLADLNFLEAWSAVWKIFATAGFV